MRPFTHSFTQLSLSSYALLLANLVPLVGVLFFGWDAKLVLCLYWMENLIIGAFNLLKMATSGLYHKKANFLFLSLFFVVHYGAFCSVHGMILVDIIKLEQPAAMLQLPDWTALFNSGYEALQTIYANFGSALWLPLAALLLSHFVSFIEYFLLRGELFKLTANKLMTAPYYQIIIMHVGLIVGAGLMEKLHSPIWLLIIIVAFKITIDYRQHVKRHQLRAASDVSNKTVI